MTPLNDLLTSFVGTAYEIRIYRTNRIVERGAMVYGAPPLPPTRELLDTFNRAPQPPQGGTGGMDEVTPEEIQRKFGRGLFIIEIADSRNQRVCGAIGVEIP